MFWLTLLSIKKINTVRLCVTTETLQYIWQVLSWPYFVHTVEKPEKVCLLMLFDYFFAQKCLNYWIWFSIQSKSIAFMFLALCLFQMALCFSSTWPKISKQYNMGTFLANKVCSGSYGNPVDNQTWFDATLVWSLMNELWPNISTLLSSAFIRSDLMFQNNNFIYSLVNDIFF